MPAEKGSGPRVTIVTAFPEFFGDFLSTSILGRAVKNGLVHVELVNLRDFGRGGYRQIDDYAFGSGGMVLAAPQLQDALNEARKRGGGKRPFVVYPSPQGPLLTQEIVETLAQQEHVVILCGHYEGMDERFVEREVDLEVTIGDCVLTGGEIPAMTIVDAMSRLVPGVVGRGEAVAEDSFYRGMLDHPHYTRPASWEGMEVPPVLLSGNEAEVLAWRRSQAVERTLSRRPDLLARAAIGDYLSAGACLAVSSPEGESRASLAALSALCRVYGLGRPFLMAGDPERRRKLSDESAGLEPAPKIAGGWARVLEWVRRRNGGDRPPLIVEILSRPEEGALHGLEVKRRCLEWGGPVLFHLSGDPEEGRQPVEGEVLLTSLTREPEDLPLEVRAAIALDRFLGKR
ncbi:MAG: tRNA (guanosine(37)-N1)-methyltransferase TrmD [Fretibacterium sp.]|nr:tRNA (guanosine(37)-N1)-methyltransferase TrmD [Fretibacterium sp.]